MKIFGALAAVFFLFSGSVFSQDDMMNIGGFVGDYDCTIVGDNAFTMFLNGTQVADGKSWDTPVNVKITLKKGDIICFIVKDDEGGKSGGLFFEMMKGKQVVLTPDKFRYTVKPADDWLTNPSVDGYLTPRMNKHEGMVIAGITNPKYAWGSPRVMSPIIYFKYVNG